MFLIADLLERAKAGANIETDYRLAKVIGITHSVISSYRHGKSMPNDKILTQICALSGDDVAVVAAQIQAERAQSDEGKTLWLMIAKRLSGGTSPAILSVLIAIGLIAATPDSARAASVTGQKNAPVSLLYIVSITFLSVWCRCAVRLRQWTGLLRLCFALSMPG